MPPVLLPATIFLPGVYIFAYVRHDLLETIMNGRRKEYSPLRRGKTGSSSGASGAPTIISFP